ncbi:AI-2E family transporter [Luteimonas dalianensis]|uniref:AI-2E family transporter n=1 Tax=Luteimonas dalianensis TaxID=1148196 RepID=UPI003BEF9B72
MKDSSLHNGAFLVALAGVSLAFLFLLRPFYAAIFWAAALAVLFWPIQQSLLARLSGRRTLAALSTLLICVLIVIIPIWLITMSVIQEVAQIYARFTHDGGSLAQQLRGIGARTPSWALEWLQRLGIDNMAALQERAAQAATQALQFVATQALSIGQNTLQMLVTIAVMLYLLFFFFRDGERIVGLIEQAIPMERAYVDGLVARFSSVVKATIRGNLIVAMVQGGLGGILFWAVGVPGAVLWGVVMTFLSMLPAVGSWLVWGPVAIWLLATGSIVRGVIVIVVGAVVIGLIDNILRPILVGRETRMPDYLVLLSTLGGLAMFGLTGFVAGPMIAALFIALWGFFISRRHPAAEPQLSAPPAQEPPEQ